MEVEQYQYAVFKEDEKVQDCSYPLYNKYSADNGFELVDKPLDEFETLLEGWAKAVKTFPNNKCLGHVEGDKYVWRTYQEALIEAQSLAKALHSKSLIPVTEGDGKRFQLMGLYSRNRPEWALTNWAIIHFSGTVVTLYNTLGEESLSYALDHTETTIVSCDGPSYKKLLKLKKDDKIGTV